MKINSRKNKPKTLNNGLEDYLKSSFWDLWCVRDP